MGDELRKCKHCGFPEIGDRLGPTGLKIERMGYCSNCLKAYDGSERKLDLSWIRANLQAK
jgi:hypothetical protein